MVEPQSTDMPEEEKTQPEAGAGPGEFNRVSSMLHTARVRAGIELSDVAERLRIRFAYLEAIEEGRFGDLPGPTYALGFVRAYADFLELDGREMVRQFKEDGQGLSRRQELIFPEPIQEGRFPGGQILITALVFAGVVYGGWYYWQHRHASSIAEVSQVPANLAALLHPKSAEPDSGVPSASSPNAPSSNAPSSNATASDSHAPAEPQPSTASEAPATGPGAEPAPVASAPSAEPQETMPAAPTPVPSVAEPVAPAAPAATPEAATPEPAAPKAATLKAATPKTTTPKTTMPKTTTPKVATSATTAPVSSNSSSGAPSSTSPSGAKTTKPVASASGAPASGSSDQQVAAKPNEPRVYGETESTSHVTLTAKQDSWLQVRDKTGTVIWTRILRTGDSYKVPDQAGLTLVTGNAGALAVTIDGKAVPALGTIGAVRRNISLDPGKLAAGTAGGQ